MESQNLIITLIPIILFALFDVFVGPRAGIVAAFVSAVALGAWYYFTFGEWDSLTTFEIGLILVLGLISIKMRNTIYFKMQPTVLGAAMAGYLAYLQIVGTPFLVRMLPLMKKLAPEQAFVFDDPRFLLLASTISFHLIFVFLFHALFVAFVARKYSTQAWIAARLLIYLLVFVTFVVDQAFYF